MGANGSLRPDGSGVTGVVMSMRLVKRGSEKIVVSKLTGRSSSTSVWNCACDTFPDEEETVSGSAFPVPVKKYQYAPAATMRVATMRMMVLDFIWVLSQPIQAHCHLVGIHSRIRTRDQQVSHIKETGAVLYPCEKRLECGVGTDRRERKVDRTDRIAGSIDRTVGSEGWGAT